MASPILLRTAAAVSVATTGAGAYYVLSEGGDAGKVEKNLRDIRTKVESTITAIETYVSNLGPPALPLNAVAVEASGPKPSDVEPASRADAESSEESLIDGQVTERQEHVTRDTQQPERVTGAFCHTCSGPRIWFFAEKFRFKRRVTPYPDHSRD